MQMIDSLPLDSKLLLFIKKTVNTPFSLNAKVVNNKLVPNESVHWLDLKSSNKKLTKLEGGTYLFKQQLDNKEYVGSAANFKDRLDLHKMQFRANGHLGKALHKQEQSRQNTLLFSIIQVVPSFLNLFRLENPKVILTQGEYEILLALTLYAGRTLEQSLINQFHPEINGGGGKYDTTVHHRFVSWDESNLALPKSIRGAIPVDIYNLDGSLEFKTSSSHEASNYLHMTYRSVPLYINNAKPFYSSTLEKFVLLRSPDFTDTPTVRKIEHQHNYVPELSLPNFKLNELSRLFLYAFDEGKTNFTTFFTLTEAYCAFFPTLSATYFNNNKYPTGVLNVIRFKINKEAPVVAENGAKYYFAKNPQRVESDFRENSVLWAISVKDLLAKLYPSTNGAATALASVGITKRMCTYNKNTGKSCKGFIFVTNGQLMNILPEIYVPGADSLHLTEAQLNAIINSLVKNS